MAVITRSQLPVNRQQLEAPSESMGVRQDPPSGLMASPTPATKKAW